MIANEIIRDFSGLINEADKRVIDRIENGTVESEPSITDRLLTEIENQVNQEGSPFIRYEARTLKDRGRNSSEKEFGADVCGVLDVDLSDFKIQKGFLVQAKWDRTTGIKVQKFTSFDAQVKVTFPTGVLKDLQEQCVKMLGITPDSFVWIYNSFGTVVVPASSIVALDSSSKESIYGKTLVQYFKEYLMCFVGDTRINHHGDKTLREVRDQTKARNIQLYRISEYK